MEIKEEKIVEFVKSFAAVEYELEPFKEHLKELKKTYIENGWLTREEISIAIKAYKMLKKKEDLEQLTDFYGTVKTMLGE